MVRQGEVIAIADDVARVSVKRAACQRCDQGRGCGAGLLTRLLSPDQFELNVPAGQLHIGQIVALAISEQHLLRISLLMYAFPLAAFLIGCGAVSLLPIDWPAQWFSDAVTLFAGLGLMILTWRIVIPISLSKLRGPVVRPVKPGQ